LIINDILTIKHTNQNEKNDIFAGMLPDGGNSVGNQPLGDGLR
jgi:hypothetical protein